MHQEIDAQGIPMSNHRERLVEKWKQRTRKLKSETYALYLAYRNPKTPWYAKIFAGLVIAYAFSPIDLIPDFIPVLGYVDDLILVPVGIALALRMVPLDVMLECRRQARTELSQDKPVTWIVAVVIVAIWVGLAILCIIWLFKFLN
jgi:uncharacterized membrane protein YkvA (DUF1232 family)